MHAPVAMLVPTTVSMPSMALRVVAVTAAYVTATMVANAPGLTLDQATLLFLAVTIAGAVGARLTFAVASAAAGWILLTGFVVNSNGHLTTTADDVMRLASYVGFAVVATLVIDGRASGHGSTMGGANSRRAGDSFPTAPAAPAPAAPASAAPTPPVEPLTPEEADRRARVWSHLRCSPGQPCSDAVLRFVAYGTTKPRLGAYPKLMTDLAVHVEQHGLGHLERRAEHGWTFHPSSLR